MGRGDKKTKKGKISMGSYGVSRPKVKSSVKNAPASKKATTPKAAAAPKKAAAKKAAPKKAAAKKAE